MVNVTNRPYVYVRFRTLKLTLGHRRLLKVNSVKLKIKIWCP
jgi:hypothetical protein